MSRRKNSSSRKNQHQEQEKHQPIKVSLKNRSQLEYLKCISNSIITFVLGPPGTGKTFLAVYYAAKLLNAGNIKKIVICRPVVNAGENLGHLPGTLESKMSPYVQPIYDSLSKFYNYREISEMRNSKTLEIVPLAYMRGRTLENSFIILDEAQNTTSEQFKMILTRIGENSKMVICGDPNQSDLPKNVICKYADLLSGIDDISKTSMSESDIVRHPIISKILSKISDL